MSNVTDWLIGNVLVTYLTLVSWRRKRRRNVPSPQLLYHRCTAEAHSLSSSAKNWCAFACTLLVYPRCGVGCVWRNMHTNCQWLVLLTLEGDWAIGRYPIMSVTLTLCSFKERGLHKYVIETFSFQGKVNAGMKNIWMRCKFFYYKVPLVLGFEVTKMSSVLNCALQWFFTNINGAYEYNSKEYI